MNKPLVSILAGTVLLTLSVTAGALGMTGALGQKVKDLSHESWMSSYADDTLVADLEIPGTHNTMALYGIADLSGQCQSLELKEQLKLGVRFIDLRLQKELNSLKAVHDIVDERESFASILKTMTGFLKEHPKETLFVSIKEEGKASGTKTFEECLQESIVAEDWWIEPNMPSTLGACRGKMVLLSRYAYPTIGIKAGRPLWRDNRSFVLNEEIFVQDYYMVRDVEKKKNEILACYKDAHPYHINFLAGYVPDSFPPKYAPSISWQLNPWLKETLPQIEHKGFSLFDFVSSELMDAFFRKGGVQ